MRKGNSDVSSDPSDLDNSSDLADTSIISEQGDLADTSIISELDVSSNPSEQDISSIHGYFEHP